MKALLFIGFTQKYLNIKIKILFTLSEPVIAYFYTYNK